MAGVALYAAIFEPDVRQLELFDLPRSHRDGPDLLNVLKTLDIPAAVAMAAERCEVRMYQRDPAGWDYPASVARKLSWDKDRFQIKTLPQDQGP